MRDLIQELEAWKHGRKSRSVDISHGNGYGADCWCIVLRSGPRQLHCSECFFMTGALIGESPEKPGIYQHAVEEGEDWGDWPGLAKVIELALAKAAEYNL